jgi:predicted HTH transcriptional regulator
MMGGKDGMMGKMMGNKKEGEEGGEMPWDMCRKMMGAIGKSSDLAAYATPELHTLFEEWLNQINEEITKAITDNENITPEELSAKFNLSLESIHYILGKLAQKGDISIQASKKR